MIDPRGLTAVEWADQTALTLSSYGVVPRLLREADWPLWAEIVLTIPAVAAAVPPGPHGFSDWHSWAERFIQVVPL